MDAGRTRPNNSEALSAKGFVPTLLHASLMQVCTKPQMWGADSVRCARWGQNVVR